MGDAGWIARRASPPLPVVLLPPPPLSHTRTAAATPSGGSGAPPPLPPAGGPDGPPPPPRPGFILLGVGEPGTAGGGRVARRGVRLRRAKEGRKRVGSGFVFAIGPLFSFIFNLGNSVIRFFLFFWGVRIFHLLAHTFTLMHY